MHNLEIKSLMVKKGVKQWQVAEALGIHESILSRWMREPLTDERRLAVEGGIDRLAIKKACDNHG